MKKSRSTPYMALKALQAAGLPPCVEAGIRQAQAKSLLAENVHVSVTEDGVDIRASKHSIRYGKETEVDQKVSIQNGGVSGHVFFNQDESKPAAFQQSSKLKEKFETCRIPKPAC